MRGQRVKRGARLIPVFGMSGNCFVSAYRVLLDPTLLSHTFEIRECVGYPKLDVVVERLGHPPHSVVESLKLRLARNVRRW